LKIDWLNNGTRLDDHLQDDRQNNFALIRLIAALIVVKQHSFSSTAANLDDSIMSTLKLSALGLPSFFFISGLLVSESLKKSSSWKNFLWKRFLRLYPAAWLSILFCALILGPLVTTWHLKDYFSSGLLYQFLSTSFLVQVKYNLPGVFENSLMGNSSVNASLWTVCLELKLYIGLLLFWLIKIRGKRYILISLIILLFTLGQIFPYETGKLIYNATGKHLNNIEITCTLIFLTGVLANIYQKKISIKNYWMLIIPFLLLIIINFQNMRLLVFLFVPLVNLFVATKGISNLKKITPAADLSYGIYVFAYPIQQVVANYLQPQGTWMFFLESLIIIIPFALFSWYMVEKKALNFKKLVA